MAAASSCPERRAIVGNSETNLTIHIPSTFQHNAVVPSPTQFLDGLPETYTGNPQSSLVKIPPPPPQERCSRSGSIMCHTQGWATDVGGAWVHLACVTCRHPVSRAPHRQSCSNFPSDFWGKRGLMPASRSLCSASLAMLLYCPLQPRARRATLLGRGANAWKNHASMARVEFPANRDRRCKQCTSEHGEGGAGHLGGGAVVPAGCGGRNANLHGGHADRRQKRHHCTHIHLHVGQTSKASPDNNSFPTAEQPRSSRAFRKIPPCIASPGLALCPSYLLTCAC